MTKKDENQHDELEKKLQDVQKEKAEQDWKQWWATQQTKKNDNDLMTKIDQLEKLVKEQEEITKRAQYDYINLKFDFERYQKQAEEKAKNMEIDALMIVVKKFLPFVENLRKSLLTVSESQKEDPMIKWLQIMYDNFIKTLEWMNIKVIESIGLTPDSFLHEPVSMQEVEDKKLKGKIIQEFERGFVYEKDGEKRVIITSKVVVWQ